MGWPLSQLDENGFALIENVISARAVDDLRAALDALPEDSATRKRKGESFARRNLLELPTVQDLAHSAEIEGITRHVFRCESQPVRGILFDKTPSANWTVPWHQDLSIAVAQRIDVPGYGPWSSKAGVTHVQPPMEVLRRMVTIRIHLDDCNEENGPLRVIPGTHHAIHSIDELNRRVKVGPQIACAVSAGGAVVMRPLILHASSPARSPDHRRVIHIEYASCNLAGGLKWNEPAFAILREITGPLAPA